jgi:hypothetical protein
MNPNDLLRSITMFQQRLYCLQSGIRLSQKSISLSRSLNHTMSSNTAASKREWLIILPDHPGASEERLKVRR